jgi:hypothetical protein
MARWPLVILPHLGCLSITLAASNLLLPRATSTRLVSSTTTWPPLTTGFTPPPECFSLTVVHSQRYVAFFVGCVGSDESCCPPESIGYATIYSPGRCPTGYYARDPHVGLDRLGMDTVEWEATCVLRCVVSLSSGRVFPSCPNCL